MVQHTFYFHNGSLIFILSVFQHCIDSRHPFCKITNHCFFMHSMNVVDGLLSVSTYWCIVRSLQFPTFYWFLTIVIFNKITVIICKLFISYDSRILLWVTFWITSLKFFVRKIVWVIMPKILIRCEIFLPWFENIIRPFCFLV